jgi:hypothetical protein
MSGSATPKAATCVVSACRCRAAVFELVSPTTHLRGRYNGAPVAGRGCAGRCSLAETTCQEDRECGARKKGGACYSRATVPVTAASEHAVAYWDPFGRIVGPVAVVLGAARRHALHGVHSVPD